MELYDPVKNGGVYICENCGCLVNDKELVVGDDPKYPNLTHSEMLGTGVGERRIIAGYPELSYVKEVKEVNDVLMLCNECNAGVVSEKKFAKKHEFEVAGFSSYGYVTKYDQDTDILTDDPEVRYGVNLLNVDAYRTNINKKANIMGSVLGGLAAVNPHYDIEQMMDKAFGQPKVREQTAEEKSSKLLYAKLKREYKACKKVGDMETAKEIKVRMDLLKNMDMV